ncbi:16S rRNA (uracil(1498)-N(3))-methyltransferase [Maritalea mediterranea]|uniref:Ribosomal RNA small subunit methyltransferase E n=1 Tax=Maritalea mediterranea TaxID=2909667 RepID=A0ABS9E4R1_9HYPH|nr:16S rRNA (uracil(1498)-N(3))-methyltransferase [Maritalea mediterranea]MCF4097787.1 16S rRNA (uracil(1498)-N(3))-methyltransferase [Maritalea mediterranea]
MPRQHKSLPRLFVDHPLSVDGQLKLDKAQSNYLVNVLRLKKGGEVILFNGQDGAFRASLVHDSKKAAELALHDRTSTQTLPSKIDYIFAPIKTARLDFMVQKATEMGVNALRPVQTQHTQMARINYDRMQANAIEAAEQCEILNVPEVHEATTLEKLIANWDETDPDRILIFADEETDVANAAEALQPYTDHQVAVLIGPEGGFSEAERTLLRAQKFCVPISLGPRILRADTAAIVALTLVQSNIGDLR